MSKYVFQPEALRRNRVYASAEYDFLVNRARECLLFRMSPEYWDDMSLIEHDAWIEAFKNLQKESNSA